MRVAVVHNLPPGGARRRLAAQMQCLGCDQVEFALGTAEPIGAGARVVPYAPLAERAARGLRPPLRYADLARLVRAWRRLAAGVRAAEVDVAFVNPCRYLKAPPALPRLGVPSLLFCDEPRRVALEAEARRSVNPTTRPLYAGLYAAQGRLDRRAVAAADCVATNSAYTAGQIRAAYGRQAEVVPMGVDGSLGPNGDSPAGHVLSVGTLIADKGHELVLEAAARARSRPPVKIVAPRPDADGQSRLTRLARGLGVPLELRTGISDEELRRAYASALVTVYMARREPFGLVSLEAQACATPVVVSREGGLPETIVDGRTGWSVPRRAEEVADSIDRLAADPALRERMASAARDHASAHTWQRSADAVRSLLEEIAR